MSEKFKSFGEFANAVVSEATGGPVDPRLNRIYTPWNTDQYYRIFDANGLEWKDVISLNTETGEIEYFERGMDGEVLVDWKSGEARTKTTTIPTPISMVPIRPMVKA